MKNDMNTPFFAEALFDALPDIVFFVKDVSGCYSHVNQSFLNRCGLKNKEDLIGKAPQDIFPPHLAENYQEQDQIVLRDGIEMRDYLELHVYPSGELGWCLTNKIALRNQDNQIIGLSGTSRDLDLPDRRNPAYKRIESAVRFIQTHYGDSVSMMDLEHITQLSTAQIERYFQKIFNMSPRHFIIKTRLDAAINMLKNSKKSITDIAIACGYQDHSAFSRVFKTTVGVTPSEYRDTKLPV